MFRRAPPPRDLILNRKNIAKSSKLLKHTLMVSSISTRDTQPAESPNDVKFNIYVWNYLLRCNIFVRKMILLWLPTHDAPPCSQTAAFYVLYVICSIWQSDSSLSRYTVVYLFTWKCVLLLHFENCNYFFNNLADIKVLRELNKGIFGNCGNVSLANV